MDVKRPKLALESAKITSVAEDTVQRISQLNNEKRDQSVSESLSNNKMQSKPVFRSKIAETSEWKSRQKSQSRGLEVTKPAPSIQARGYRQYLRTVPANPIGGSGCASFFDTQQTRRVVK